MTSNQIKTAEAVSIGHPDKVCDQIADAILDACLEKDPNTRSAIEVLGGHGIITVTGELTTTAYVNIREIAQRVYKSCGYDERIGVQVNVVEQSPEIAHGVDNEGAGDQGIMVGYATDETPELMPLEVMLARKMVKKMGRRDGKSQVTMDGKEITKIITSICNFDKYLLEYRRWMEGITKKYRTKKLSDVWMYNPNGKWLLGGFNADTGLTGRKLAVDNYGPYIPVGGGCFSGKDATKVDRSAAYMARKIAVDFVKKGAKKAYVHLAYSIGIAQPVMAVAEVDGKELKVTGYDLRPRAIIDFLQLRKPQFEQTAKYGHFGNGFRWDN